MIVTVQLFAGARERAGRSAIQVELSDAATVGDLRQALVAQWPALGELMPLLMFAVDADYADDRTLLTAQSDIAAIPPVSGG